MDADPAQQMPSGLSEQEASERLSRIGPNRIAKPREISFLGIAKEEITEPMILLLLGVGFFYTIFGELRDALTLYAIIAALVVAEIANEYRAKKAISSLAVLASPKTKVLRDARITEVATESVVPGDLLVLVSGTRIAADGNLLSSVSLQVDESSLTGESFPTEKFAGDESFGGTLVIAGEGLLEVKQTGARTRIGKIAALAQEIRPPKTPLQLAMKALAKTLVFVALFFSVIIPLIGFLQGQPLREMFLIGLALAFATIPEELPIIITMNLGLGSFMLARENFLVKKLKAAETLGNATVIVTDKTGTITESRMQVVACYPPGDEPKILQSARSAMTPLSLSITDLSIIGRAEMAKIRPGPGTIVRERSFNNQRKTRTVVRERDGTSELFMTGAPEEVLAAVSSGTQDIRQALEQETAQGRRVVAVAHRSLTVPEKDAAIESLERDLVFDGLIAIEDPPRPGVRETIERAHRAGIRTIMMTGDHPKTAAAIAAQVGIRTDDVLDAQSLDALSGAEIREAVKKISVFARAVPEHKYRIVKALQDNGEVVAVTGDGVNDSLALKGADIGIAMGIKGTDAAKEAADIVLADDNFVTVGKGIFAGRRIFDNLSKGVKYYLSVKVALVAVFCASLVLALPFPFSPIQIILLELFMDLGASASFVAEPAEPSVDVRPPRDPRSPFLNTPMLSGIAVGGIALFLTVFLTYWLALHQGFDGTTAATAAFSAWITGHILLAFVSRSTHDPLYRIGILTNRVMVLWAAGAFLFLGLALSVPLIGQRVGVSAITPGNFMIIVLIAVVFMAGFEISKIVRSLKNSK
ncbi:MAG: cation-transporting P-type ATPase [Methanoregula sp.]|nr:cation-transporting P-type ATPase [Methanoregula sp.]